MKGEDGESPPPFQNSCAVSNARAASFAPKKDFGVGAQLKREDQPGAHLLVEGRPRRDALTGVNQIQRDGVQAQWRRFNLAPLGTTGDIRATAYAERRAESTGERSREASSQRKSERSVGLHAVDDVCKRLVTQHTASLLPRSGRRRRSGNPRLFRVEKLLEAAPLTLQIRSELSRRIQPLQRFYQLLKLPDVFHQNFEFFPVNRNRLSAFLDLHSVLS